MMKIIIQKVITISNKNKNEIKYINKKYIYKIMIYTEEQYRILQQATPHFESVKHEVIKNAPRWLTEQIINVYEQATHKTIFNKDLSCAVCVMNIYKLIGKTFDEDTKERVENSSKNEDVTLDKINVTSDKTDVSKVKKNVSSVKKSKKVSKK